MLELHDLTINLKKLEYYIANSNGGFVVWECNEYASKVIIERKLRKYANVKYIDILNFKRQEYLALLTKQDDDFEQKRIFVFKNFSEAYAYDNHFDISTLLLELNFTRDIWIKYEYVYIFIMPTYLVDKIAYGSPSFWSYVSVHFRIPNMIHNPLELTKINQKVIEPYDDNLLTTIFNENNRIVNQNKYTNSDFVKEQLLIDMLELNKQIKHDIDLKILGIIYYNLSRLYSINKEFRESLTYARKSNEILKTNKSELNVLYCDLNMGSRSVQKSTFFKENIRVEYFEAIEHFAYGNYDLAREIAEFYICRSTKINKYYFLFLEIMATINFVQGDYRSAIDKYFEIAYLSDKNRISINMDIIYNNIDIAFKELDNID